MNTTNKIRTIDLHVCYNYSKFLNDFAQCHVHGTITNVQTDINVGNATLYATSYE